MTFGKVFKLYSFYPFPTLGKSTKLCVMETNCCTESHFVIVSPTFFMAYMNGNNSYIPVSALEYFIFL
ncbi:hypothetical protein EB796_024175 [Bugula neritina]|nr:hypothetical protein EB796_024175 [Bugula neritina]